MPRLSTLSNPTGLIELDKSRVVVVIDESNGNRSCCLSALDLGDLKLPAGLNVVLIVSRGNCEERLDLGPVESWNKTFVNLSDIGSDGAWSFRLLLVKLGDPKIFAVAEGIRPNGQGDAESFVALEPADLGQVPWEIVIQEIDGRAIIRFNNRIYVSSGEASSDTTFVSFVLPEAIRRIIEYVTSKPECVEDECWAPLRSWLHLYGVDTTEIEELSDYERPEWCRKVVALFCERFEFVEQIRQVYRKGEDE